MAAHAEAGSRGADALCLMFLLVLALGGCARLPVNVERPASAALDNAAVTKLGQLVMASTPDPELSGFRLLPLPAFSLDARIELARRAERSLDVQYYLIQNDVTGRILLRALRDAALRGVRVRILVDDLYTAQSEALLRALAAHPQIEVRLFNPFPAGRGSLATRLAASLFEFDRVNRRMHNKLFIADNAMAVAGGRNMADAYFQRDSLANFIDMDVLAAGPVVARLSSFFDVFWNSPQVYPIESLVPSDAPDAVLRARFDAMTSPITTPAPAAPDSEDRLGHNALSRDLAMRADLISLTWSHAEAFSDLPSKVLSTAAAGEPLTDAAHDTVLFNVRQLVRAAQDEVFETMPYLIPGPEGMRSIRLLRERGVRFNIVTNSLAASDEPLVHSGYRRYRVELLRLGVELYELSPRRTANAAGFGTLGSVGGRLHGKLAVVDGKSVFVGSMNFDPRSDARNTELGLIISSTAIAQQMRALIVGLEREGAYRVQLNADDQRLEWLEPENDVGEPGPIIHREEPEADPWTRWKLELLAPLIPESLL